MPKKVIAGFLLLTLLFFSFRHLMFKHHLGFQKHKFRTELFASANPNIIAIRMAACNLYKNQNGIEWKDNNKEIIYKGLYHEVLHISINNAIAEISLIEDAFENSLIASFYNTLSKEDPVHQLLSDLLNFKFTATFNQSLFINSCQIITHWPASVSGTLSAHNSSVFIPPKA